MEGLDLLILGAGWTATFLIPLLEQRKIAFAATTTTGRPVAGHPTLPFRFDPASPDLPHAIAALPHARHILITFPLSGTGPSRLLVSTYEATHRGRAAQAVGSIPEVGAGGFRFIQLGSTGIWQGQQGQTAVGDGHWLTRHSSYDTANKRAVAEDELIAIGGCVLELSGLWGAARDPKNWVGRVAMSKEAVKGKKSLHLIHGVDVARAVAAVVASEKWEGSGKGQRWMLTDGFVYDWWSLLVGWAEGAEGGEGEVKPTEQAKWVFELMGEEDVRALPRSMEQLGRCYDTREFWLTFGLVPLRGRV
ncbi:hypothetical protein B0T25DRAFT_582031 [Lasiosphaeria hispida]|uniref:NAD(P)-binding protein n=1 Tax=Lasiosphaeria hispida TaxID=260671 RepID=A0AAJ0HE70_9PEZI|nr:hypothetical protein B0T25DRAFT_582031 [Lasiosphaeria hispida]